MTIKSNSGYAALMSSIIISAVLIILLLSSSYSIYLGRFDILTSEVKERSEALAEACANAAILNIFSDPSYDGDQTMSLPEGECKIMPITIANTIDVQAIYNKSYTNFRIEVDPPSRSISSWKELPAF